MKIFDISLKETDYDEFDGWIVIAKTEEDVRRLCNIRKEKGSVIFSDNQYEDNIDHIKEIGIANDDMSEGIILGSYNSG